MKHLSVLLQLMIVLFWGQIALGQSIIHTVPEEKKIPNMNEIVDLNSDFKSSSLINITTLDDPRALFRTNNKSNYDQVLSLSSDTTSLFDAVYEYSVPGGGPNILVSGDFNDDGIIDIAVSGFCTPYLFIGRGNGTFQKSGALPIDVKVAGDFNQDGELDIANDEGSISLGNGNGTFQIPSAEMVSDGTCAVSDDFDNDGKLDLAIPIDSTVSILLGNGDGSLKPPVRYLLYGPCRTIASGDFNNDGNKDLAINMKKDSSTILLGIGNGSFIFSSHFPGLGAACHDIKAADFNNDGYLDLASVSRGNTYGIFVFLGAGDGTFSSKASLKGSVDDWSLTTADFNGDGNIDIAVPGCFVIFGNGDGTFQPTINYPADVGYVQGIVAADFNGDSKIDIAAGTRSGKAGTGFFSVLINKNNGTFPLIPSYGVYFNPEGIVSDDFNNDKNVDIVTSNFGSNNISVLIGNGEGTFKSKVDYAVGDGPASVISADFNDDGIRDMATANQNSGSLSILIGIGDGTFQTPISIAGCNTPVSVTAGDFNNDGKLDLAVSDIGNDGCIIIFKGNGDGTFQLEESLPGIGWGYTVYLHRFLNWIISGDYNRDGKLDIAATDYVGGQGHGVSIFLGNGDFKFQPKVIYRVGGYPGYVGMGDFNEDGILDIATADAGNDYVSILVGNGDGTFQSSVHYKPGNMPVFLAIGDMDGDGHQDIVAANTYSYNISILRGWGNGTFKEAESYGSFGAHSVAMGDYDNNGYYDLAVSGFPGVVSILISKLGNEVKVSPINEIPNSYILYQNYPNPFNPSTTIVFHLPVKSAVSLKIYNLLGQEASILISEELMSGTHEYLWNAANLSNGVYFYRLQAGAFTDMKKLLIMK